MSLIVQKYGGTSVGDPDRIKRVAARVARTRRAGHSVIVIVSAMGKTTDDLIGLAAEINPDPPGREMDMLLTSGERISMALLAMALDVEGVTAKSLTGSQAGILTDDAHGEAKITEIKGDRIQNSLADGHVVIVAGFQGVSPDTKEITTLGRGGSDATAVALAAAHNADVCEIYTDVDGIFTADPRIVPSARKLDEVSFKEMLELAASGAGVLMARAVEFGRRFGIPIHVRSSFHEGEGTWVKETTMEAAIVSGVAHDTSEAKVTVKNVPDRARCCRRCVRSHGARWHQRRHDRPEYLVRRTHRYQLHCFQSAFRPSTGDCQPDLRSTRCRGSGYRPKHCQGLACWGSHEDRARHSSPRVSGAGRQRH